MVAEPDTSRLEGAPLPALLLAPLAAERLDASQGVWARQLPVLLSLLLRPVVEAVAPLEWTPDGGALVLRGRPASVEAARAEAVALGAAAVAWGAIAACEEGGMLALAVAPVGEGEVERWSSRLDPARPLGVFDDAVAWLVGWLERQGLARAGSQPGVARYEVGAEASAWPLLCDLEVEQVVARQGERALAGAGHLTSHAEAAAAPAGAGPLPRARWQARRAAAPRPPGPDAAPPDLRPETAAVLGYLGITWPTEPAPRES
jgi:hypothetical protein